VRSAADWCDEAQNFKQTRLQNLNHGDGKMKKALLIGFVLLFGSAAFAQSDPKVEVSGNYSYMRFNPENSNIISSFSLNGGGGAFAYFFTDLIGIKAEFEGYGSTQRTLAATGTTVQANLFTYNVGPFVKYRHGRFQPFGEAMFGGAHSNAYVNICNVSGACIGSPSNNAFDFIIGGGVDIPVTPTISIRPAEIDFVLTRFGNAYTGGNNNQSNLRYQAGVVFTF
jgi:Outer membrane protein beta-barrel domain